MSFWSSDILAFKMVQFESCISPHPTFYQTRVYFDQTFLGDSFSVFDCPVSRSSLAELISSWDQTAQRDSGRSMHPSQQLPQNDFWWLQCPGLSLSHAILLQATFHSEPRFCVGRARAGKERSISCFKSFSLNCLWSKTILLQAPIVKDLLIAS